MAAAVSTEFSVVSGGLACIVGAAIFSLAMPAFRRYQADRPVETPAGTTDVRPPQPAGDGAPPGGVDPPGPGPEA